MTIAHSQFQSLSFCVASPRASGLSAAKGVSSRSDGFFKGNCGNKGILGTEVFGQCRPKNQLGACGCCARCLKMNQTSASKFDNETK